MENIKELPLERNRLLNAGFLLLCLCILDSALTDYGLRSGQIQEANPLVAFLYEQNILLYYAVKIGLPLVLLYLVTAARGGVLLRICLTTALFLYISVIGLHIFWLTISSM